MKRLILFVLFLLPLTATAQEQSYPWILTGYGGGSRLCTVDGGCGGGLNTFAFGGSFGRYFTKRWGFEIEGLYSPADETEPPRFDEFTGVIFTPVLHHRRIWGGGAFLGDLAKFKSGEFFIALGFGGAVERLDETAPEGIFVEPGQDIGIKAGVCGGAGLNWWFSQHWGIRPEVRFYGISEISFFRYTVGLSYKF